MLMMQRTDRILRRIESFVGYGLDEKKFMIETVLKLRPEQIWEWGTNVGASARIFFFICYLGHLECDITTIELPNPKDHVDHPGLRYASEIADLPVTKILGDGITEALARADPTKRLLFFLDGDHTKESVENEITLLCEKFPEAWLLLHDTRVGGPKEAIDGLLDSVLTGHEISYIPSQTGITRVVPLRLL